MNNFKPEYKEMTFEEMEIEHARILNADDNVTNVQLLIRFHRGMLYLEICSRFDENCDFKKWILEKLGISYDLLDDI